MTDRKIDHLLSALEALGKFAIAEEINEGMNARAFHAENTHLKRRVFLKVYHYDDAYGTEALAEPRLLVEATSSPASAHLVQIYEAEVISVGNDKYLCLQMEWVEGSSLLGVVSARTSGQQESIRIAIGILHGVLHLHSRNILHRDLKPANILLQGAVPKIGDFGSARILAAGATHVPASKHSALYRPPEAFQTPSHFSKKSDVYQVGMVLYELINGPLIADADYYVSKSQRRAFAAQGTPYDELCDWDKSQAQDVGICDLATRRRLLSYGVASAPYLSRKVMSTISAATHPIEHSRIDATEFLRRLGTLDVPNWCGSEQLGFCCPGWRGNDWRVDLEKGQYVARRSRAGTGNFRRVTEYSGAVLQTVFESIESM